MKRCLALLALTLVPTSVWAKDTLHNWSALNPSGLSTVYVLNDTGQETTGTLLRLDADSLVVLIDGREQRFEAARVKRLAKRGDSLKNGLYIGAIIGAALGGLLADCSYQGRGCGTGRRAGYAAVSVGFWAAVGGGIDALKQGRTTLYEAPASGSGSVPQPPLAQQRYPGVGAVNVTVTW